MAIGEETFAYFLNGDVNTTLLPGSLQPNDRIAVVRGDKTHYALLDGFVSDPLTTFGATVPRYMDLRLADTRNVKDFGAVLDGVADDTAAFQLAYDATPDDGSIIVPRGGYNVTTQGLTPRPHGHVLWKLDGNRYRTETLPVVYAEGFDDVTETFISGRKNFGKLSTNTTSLAVVNISHDFNNANGSSGVAAGLRVGSIAEVDCGNTFVWGFSSDITSRTVGTNQHLAGAFTMRKASGNAPVFALYAQAYDLTGLPSTDAGNIVTCEMDLFANGADTPLGRRSILDLVWGRPDGSGPVTTDPLVVHRAFVIGPKSIDLATSSVDMHADFVGTFNQASLNLRRATQGPDANAIWLNTGHRIGLDDAGTDGAANVAISSNGSRAFITGGLELPVDSELFLTDMVGLNLGSSFLLQAGDTVTANSSPITMSYKVGLASGAISILGFNTYMSSGGIRLIVNSARNAWSIMHDVRDDIVSGDLTFSHTAQGTGTTTTQFTMDATGLFRFGTLPTSATDDAGASAAGVPIGGVYRNGSVLMVRVT